MRDFLKISVILVLLLSANFANADPNEPAKPALNIKIIDPLNEQFTFEMADDSSGTAIDKQIPYIESMLTIPLQTKKNENDIKMYDANHNLLATIHYFLESVYFYIDGAQAGPDWEWRSLNIGYPTSDSHIQMIVTKDTTGSCTDSSLDSCSQTAEITIQR